MKKNRLFILCTLICATLIISCKSGPFNLIKAGSPHQQYERKLQQAGLDKTSMGATWIANAQASLRKAINITLPYQEAGYFAAEKIEAIAFRFNAVRGQKINVQLTRKPVENFMIYADLWELDEQLNHKLLVAADTLGNALELEVKQTGNYVLRLQPELLGAGSYNLAISSGASLAYPLKAVNRNQIQSLFGVGRDAGARKHEGIDIFSGFRTPVLAVADGTVTRVNTNNLGGKVVWFRPKGKDFTLYYAHLDEQLVEDGASVLLGDTLGLMGNTGNAATTPPHLHLGIYTNGGAIDPLPFIDPQVQKLPTVTSSIDRLNTTMRLKATVNLEGRKLVAGNLLRVSAASKSEYRVELPDGSLTYLPSNKLTAINAPLSAIKARSVLAAYDGVGENAAPKFEIPVGSNLELLGTFEKYSLVKFQTELGWIKLE
ncbi:MAG: M23 family metallopeptidase [Flavobacteriales bacterium]|nr:MAG: M23 family metallopeptidase [Flavobacteriales bacterium]